MPSGCRLVAALTLVVLSLALPTRAFAWVDLKVSADEIRVTVDAAGTARVEHRVTLLVSGGPLKRVTLRGVDDDATVLEGGYVVLEANAAKGAEGAVPISVERVFAKKKEGSNEPDRTDLSIDLDGGAGIKRGAWILDVSYKTDLRKSGALTKDGATELLKWTGPAWDDGLDATKATFVLPSAPTPPRVAEPADEDDLGAGTVLSTFKRDGATDVLSLTRAYAPKGERVAWMARVDSRAFGDEGEKKAPSPRAASREHAFRDGARDTGAFALGVLLVVVLTALVGAKSFEIKRLAADRGAEERPLIPLPALVRAPLAGLAVVGGVALELVLRSTLAGAATVALGALLAAERTPRHTSPLRGPGRWLSVNLDEGLRAAPRPRALLDSSTLVGKLLFAALLGATGMAAMIMARQSRFDAALIGLDAAPLFAIFFTGRLDQLPPDPAAAPVAFFRRVARLIEKGVPGARVVPRVRVPEGSGDADELRLALLPARPMSGLRAIEVAMSYAPGLGGYVAMPEVFVRCQVKSDADARANGLAAHGRVLRGKKLDERVLVLGPKLPTARSTADLLRALAASFTDHEKTGRATVPSKPALAA